MTAPAYLPPPTRCESLASMVARFGGSCAAVLNPQSREPRSLTYALPAHATDELLRYFGALRTVELAPELTARLPGGRVYGPGIVVSPDGCSLARDVSGDFGSPPDGHWLLAHDRIRPPVTLAGDTAVVAVNLGARYCHWLLEELPRLLALGNHLPSSSPERPALISHGGTAFIREAFASDGLAAWRGRVIEAGKHTHFACEQLIVPGLTGRPGAPTPRMLGLLCEFTAPLRRPATAGRGGRLYITRELAGRRRVVNEAALWSQLEARGFVKLRLEELSWAEQIAAFAQAREIVAPHGAGLANLVFCPPGVRIVEFFNRAYVNPCFWRMAALAGLDYRPVVSGATAGGGALPECRREAGKLDIEADIGEVVHALNAG